MITASKKIALHTKAELLAILDNFEDWTGKDAVVAAVQNATTDEAARKLYAIGVYLPHGRRIYEAIYPEAIS